ncbi:hypothetical protein Micbo1qcDRAFT_180952 [Microdochium bolleyi]|uniref:Fork-head domain-containing protein n=1 Tax=Microdochium bolleyi TaxID=196109 RepID=A0A136IJZ6_9PEZI|nr:hypothetical protein Micbo1qcDRAFT_180952 [Microdochium bolleyi]
MALPAPVHHTNHHKPFQNPQLPRWVPSSPQQCMPSHIPVSSAGGDWRPQCCWSYDNPETGYTPSAWPTNQQTIPSYDFSLVIGTYDINNSHPVLENDGWADALPLLTESLGEAFIKKDSDGGGDGAPGCYRNVPGDDIRASGNEGVISYAKLIRKALLDAPGNSMTLQDIYKWFKQNVSKADPTDKGWMNSVRSNLSMNAAFRIQSRPISPESRKKKFISEWHLEGFAKNLEALKSTSSYRSRNKDCKRYGIAISAYM